MSDTRLADILDALYDGLIAETYIAAEISAERLKAFDGGAVTDWSAISMLVIGGRPFPEDLSETTSSWDWGSLGVSGTSADVDEWIFVPCGIATQLGETDLRAARRTAIAIYAAAAAFIRGTTLSIPQVMWCIPQPNALRQEQTSSGAEVFVDFTAAIRTRI